MCLKTYYSLWSLIRCLIVVTVSLATSVPKAMPRPVKKERMAT